jgi:hypothetical protein
MIHLFAILGVLLLAPATGGERAPAGRRIPVAGGWTVLVPADFKVIDNGDSVQALKESRIVYLSAPLLPAAAKDDGAHALCEQMSALFVKVPRKDRLTHAAGALEGRAGFFLEGSLWRFKGVMCARGTVVLAVADLEGAKDRDWAVAVWRSFEHQ